MNRLEPREGFRTDFLNGRKKKGGTKDQVDRPDRSQKIYRRIKMQRGKKTVSMFLVLAFIASASMPLCAAPKKASPAKKPAKKIVKPVKKSVISKPAAKKVIEKKNETNIEETGNENVSDVREEMNSSIADLKGQLDTVKQDNSDAKVSGVIFFAYSKPLSGVKAGTYNAFDLTRAYVNFKEKLSDDASMRITLDAARLTASSTFTGSPTTTKGSVTTTPAQNLLDYVKYAYVEMPIKIPSVLKVIPYSLTAKVGLQQTAWIDYDEGIQGTRYIMKTLLDNEGVMTSADFGVGATGAFTLPYLPEVQYIATLTNGAGYKSAETNPAKDLGIRLNSTVYSNDSIGNVAVAALLSMKDQFENVTTNTHQGALEVSLTNKDYGNAFAEYVKGTLGNPQLPIQGTSIGCLVYPSPSMLPGVAVVAREDYYDSNTSSSGSTVINRTLYGMSYDYGKNIKFAVDVQNTTTGGGTTSSMLYVNNQVLF